MVSPFKFETALKIIQEASTQLGVPPPDKAYGSFDLTALRMGSLLNNAGNVLADMDPPWQQLKMDVTFNGDGVTTTFPLPEDFNRFIDNTGWSNSITGPVGVVTDRVWSAGKAWMSSGMTVTPVARLIANSVEFFTPPAAGSIITFQAVNNNWVIDGNSPTTTFKYRCERDNDIPQFDWLLMLYSVKKLWLDSNGMDSATATNEMNFRLGQLQGRNQPGQILGLNSGTGTVANPIISGANLPLTGYGA